MANITNLKGTDKLREAYPVINQNLTNLNVENEQQDQRIDNLVGQSGSSNTEIVDARDSTVKNKTFAVLKDRLEGIESDAINFPSMSLYRQAVINFNFDVWQRGTTFSAVPSLAYTADRWKTSNSIDNNVKILQSSTVPNKKSKYSMRIEQMTTVGGVNATTDVYQPIEDYQFFQGQKVTFSGWVKCDPGVTVTPKMNDSVGSNSGAPITSTSWTFFSVTRTIDNAATQMFPLLEINRNALAVGAGANYSQLQVNVGDVSLSFQPRSFAEELALCQRYYEKSYNLADAPGTATTTGAKWIDSTGIANMLLPSINFMVRKRLTPTVTIYSTSGVSGKVRQNIATPVDLPTLQNSNSETGMQIYISGTSGAAGDDLYYHYIADAEL